MSLITYNADTVSKKMENCHFNYGQNSRSIQISGGVVINPSTTKDQCRNLSHSTLRLGNIVHRLPNSLVNNYDFVLRGMKIEL